MDNLITILDQSTVLNKDVDLFAYEIPLETGGLWLADSRIESRFNGTGAKEFNCYYRGKNKQRCIDNVNYLKETIDAMSGSNGTCSVGSISNFKLTMLYEWDYLEKDGEGYYVFSTVLRLLV